MHITNFECKARVNALQPYELRLQQFNPRYAGEDRQVDTYFNTRKGRLKLREGNIENALIQYDRDDKTEARKSSIVLYRHTHDAALKEILTRQLGVNVVVDKIRRIYFIDNVKFHFDEVQGLGYFVEIEAIDDSARFSPEELKSQCDHFIRLLELDPASFVEQSYADLLIPRIQIIRTDSAHPDFQALVRSLDEYLSKINGQDDAYYAHFNTVSQIKYVVVAYVDGYATGCGAIKEFAPGVMEVKRMFTLPDHRSRGIAKQVLHELEVWAMELGTNKTVLETSVRLPAAISLYLKNRYLPIPNYGQYAIMEDSRCFEKTLNGSKI